MGQNKMEADQKAKMQKEWDQKLAITSRTERLILYFSAIVLLASTYIAWNIADERLLQLLVSLAAAMAVAMLSRFLLGAAHIEGSFLGLKITGVTQGFAIFILAFIAFYFLIKPQEHKNMSLKGNKRWIEIRNPGKEVWDIHYKEFYWYNALYVNASRKFYKDHYRNIHQRGMTYNLLLFAPFSESSDTTIFRERFNNMRIFLQRMNQIAKKQQYSNLASKVVVKVSKENSLPGFSFFRAEKDVVDPYIILYVDKVFNSVDDTPNHLLLLRDKMYEDRFKEVFNEDWAYTAEHTFELNVEKLMNQSLKFSKWTDWEKFRK